MSDNVKELKQCTRCHSTILLKYFDTNRKGEYYKTCRNCLTRDRKTKHEYDEDNKDEILDRNKDWQIQHRDKYLAQKKQYKEENKDYILETLTCECGGSYTRHHQARHLKSLKHNTYLVQHVETSF